MTHARRHPGGDVTPAAMQLLPAAPGTCAVCAAKHEAHHAHDVTSLFYQMRFQMQHGRGPTWADACAHLTPLSAAAWRKALGHVGVAWTDTAAPIAEAFSISGGAAP